MNEKRYYQISILDETNSRPLTHFDNRMGSTNKREARKLATEAHREHPDCEIGVIYCTVDDDYCDKYVAVYARKGDDETETFLNWGR